MTTTHCPEPDLKAFIEEDEKRTRKVYEEEGWLVN